MKGRHMSLNIETLASISPPWYGLGSKVPAELSPEQMAVKAGLNWRVEKVPAFSKINGVDVPTGWSSLVRDSDNKILDLVTDDWCVNQNEDAFRFFNEFCELGEMSMDTAGALDGGRMVFALAKVNESFEVFGGDRVDSYLLFSNPHKFGHSIDVKFTPIRISCYNSLVMAIRTPSLQKASEGRTNSVRQTHRSEFDAEKVKVMLGAAHRKLESYRKDAEFLGSKEYTDSLLRKYMLSVFPKAGAKKDSDASSKLASIAMAIVETQPGAEFARNSWWQAFNAATYVVDHIQGRTQETRLRSAWYGMGKTTKLDALSKAILFAKGDHHKLEKVEA